LEFNQFQEKRQNKQRKSLLSSLTKQLQLRNEDYLGVFSASSVQRVSKLGPFKMIWCDLPYESEDKVEHFRLNALPHLHKLLMADVGVAVVWCTPLQWCKM